MRTVNLLPNKAMAIDGTAVTLGAIQALLMVCLIGLISLSGWLHSAISSVAAQVNTKQVEKDQLKSSLDHANQLQQELQNIVDRQQSWQALEKLNNHFGQLMSEIAAASPEKLRLTTLNAQDTTLSLSGTAGLRSDVTTFVDNLNKIKTLTNVTLGQANSQDSAVTFSVTATLSTDTSSPQPPKAAQ